MRSNVIVDLDHTVSDATPRDHLLGGDWDIYHLGLIDDKLCTDIAHIIKALHMSECWIVGVTGRPEKWRPLTTEWLCKRSVKLDELLMRPDDCYMPNNELKLALVREHFGPDFHKEILCVIDDNAEVISTFNAHGVTCLQCFGRSYP